MCTGAATDHRFSTQQRADQSLGRPTPHGGPDTFSVPVVPKRRSQTVCFAALVLMLAACRSSYVPSASVVDAATQTAIMLNRDFSCPSDAGEPSGSVATVTGRPLRLATTVAPITSIVSNIAGNRAVVSGVIPEGEDSHTYEPKPSVAEQFSRADIVFINGLSLENPTRDLARTNLPPTGRIVELGARTVRPEQYIYDFSFPRDGGKPNPHLWTNPPMARCFATIVAATLAESDPANADYYRQNAARFSAKLDDLDQRFAAASAAMPAANRTLLTYHDAYAYFAAHYGWKILGAVQVSSFDEPTPKEVVALIRQVRRERVPAIFGSEVFPSAILAQIGKEANVRYVDDLRDDDLPGKPGDANHSFLGLMKADFVTMISSLNGDATALSLFDASDVTPDEAEYPQ
jgi:ABC-type Zn uptake system ZnuABC Zn-binding protein ZnuA